MGFLYKRTLWKKPAKSVALDPKTSSVLAEAGVSDMAQLENMTDEEILSIKGIGPSRLKEIREVLAGA